MAVGKASKSILEVRDIDPIPVQERHGKPRDLFFLWFTPNVNILGLVTGATAISLGLSLAWAIIACVVGTAIGGGFMAYHSAQGPRLGLAQMIQSRAQFGSIGNIIPCVVTVIDGVGYALLTYLVTGQALALLLKTSLTVAIVISGVVSLVVAMAGYRWIHKYQRYLSVLVVAMFILWTIQIVTLKTVQHAPVHVTFGAFVLAVAIFLASTLSWAPFVSDYSRYLPEDSSVRQLVGYTFFGTFVATVWAQVLGAIVASRALDAFSTDSVGYVIRLSPAGALWILALVTFGSQVAPTILELYAAFLSTLTGVRPFRQRAERGNPVVRAGVLVGLAAIAVVGAIVAEQYGLVSSMSNFLTLLAYLLMPWTAINLVDYYLIRHGRYSPEEFFPGRRRSAWFRWPAVVIYLGCFGLEFLFMDSPLFTGPIAHSLGGGDLSWVVGIFGAGFAYYGWARFAAPGRTAGISVADTEEAADSG